MLLYRPNALEKLMETFGKLNNSKLSADSRPPIHPI